VVWLVSHLKARGRRTLTSHSRHSGVCPGAAEEEVSDARGEPDRTIRIIW
jgi:hypothetical protein